MSSAELGQTGRVHIEADLRLPTDAKFVGAVRDSLTGFLEVLDAPEEVVNDVQILVTEACGNAVRHASHRDGYRIVIAADAGVCRLEIIDHGPGITADVAAPGGTIGDAGGVADGDAADGDVDGAEQLAERGRGLFVINALADRVELGACEQGTKVRLEKRWSA